MAAAVPATYVPAKSVNDSAMLHPAAPALSAPRKLRVVLVDDEPSILKTWKAILEAHDFDVIGCERAPQALSAIAAGCDCVLTDYHMPDMTGIEIIRAARPYSNAKFVVMTGNDSPKLRVAATAAGAACVFSKPAPIKSVIEIIEKLCGKNSC